MFDDASLLVVCADPRLELPATDAEKKEAAGVVSSLNPFNKLNNPAVRSVAVAGTHIPKPLANLTAARGAAIGGLTMGTYKLLFPGKDKDGDPNSSIAEGMKGLATGGLAGAAIAGGIRHGIVNPAVEANMGHAVNATNIQKNMDHHAPGSPSVPPAVAAKLLAGHNAAADAARTHAATGTWDKHIADLAAASKANARGHAAGIPGHHVTFSHGGQDFSGAVVDSIAKDPSGQRRFNLNHDGKKFSLLESEMNGLRPSVYEPALGPTGELASKAASVSCGTLWGVSKSAIPCLV